MIGGNFMINIKKFQKKRIEEIDFCLDLSNCNKIMLSTEKQKNDKRVDIIDPFGRNVRTSNILLGKNKYNILLEDGEYIPLKEIKNSLKKFFDNPTRKIVCKGTKKVVSSKEASEKIIKMLKNSGEILVGTKHSKIKNQNTAKVYVKGKGHSSFIKKGVFLLGNKGIELSCGEYINTKELDEILNEFTILENSKGCSFPFFKNKRRLKLGIYFLISAMLASVGIFIGKGEKNSQKKYAFYQNYNMSFTEDEPIMETEEEIIKRVTSQFQIGSKIEIKEGIKYYSSSDYMYNNKSISETIGNEIRSEGQYEINRLAILEGQTIISTSNEPGNTFYDQIKDNLDNEEDLESFDYRIHLTSPETGWVNIQDLLDEKELTSKQIGNKVVIEKEYKPINKNLSIREQKVQLLRLKRQYLIKALEAKKRTLNIRKKELKKF